LERGVKTFAEDIKRGKGRSAKIKLERIAKRFDRKDEFQHGYLTALEGMVSAVESGDDLTLLKQIANSPKPREKIEQYLAEMQTRVSQDFRPREEIGYNTAWVEVLQAFINTPDKQKQEVEQPVERTAEQDTEQTTL